jgi:hypothetical protein
MRFRMSLQSAIIGFLASKTLAIPITPQENVVVQTTAVATGTVRHLLCSASERNQFRTVDASSGGICRHHPCAGLA